MLPYFDDAATMMPPRRQMPRRLFRLMRYFRCRQMLRHATLSPQNNSAAFALHAS